MVNFATQRAMIWDVVDYTYVGKCTLKGLPEEVLKHSPTQVEWYIRCSHST